MTAALLGVGFLVSTTLLLIPGQRWHLPAGFGVSEVTAHRRFVARTKAGLRRRLHVAELDRAEARPFACSRLRPRLIPASRTFGRSTLFWYDIGP